jgi:hypothetical protein
MRMGGWELDSDDCVLAAAPRDPSASAAFYRRYERSMLAFFVRRTGDPELAGDLTAKVFAAALDSCAPDGVTTGTLYYGARDSGSPAAVHAIGNVWILPLHGRPPQDGFPDKIMWRSASGAVIKTIQGR